MEALREHLAGGSLNDSVVFDAVCMRLAAAIEETERIDRSLRDRVFGEDWVLIKAMRNAIVHNNAFVDATLIEDTVARDLDGFENGLRELQRTLGA